MADEITLDVKLPENLGQLTARLQAIEEVNTKLTAQNEALVEQNKLQAGQISEFASLWQQSTSRSKAKDLVNSGKLSAACFDKYFVPDLKSLSSAYGGGTVTTDMLDFALAVVADNVTPNIFSESVLGDQLSAEERDKKSEEMNGGEGKASSPIFDKAMESLKAQIAANATAK